MLFIQPTGLHSGAFLPLSMATRHSQVPKSKDQPVACCSIQLHCRRIKIMGPRLRWQASAAMEFYAENAKGKSLGVCAPSLGQQISGHIAWIQLAATKTACM
jgi:hypothetical protein